MSAVTLIIIINVVLYFANGLIFGDHLTPWLMMTGGTLLHPEAWYRVLTYGFAHDPSSFVHILCNMFVLFFFGPPVERKYGSAEFLLIYLLAIITGGLVWGIFNLGSSGPPMLGASGAVTAVVILFSFLYPNAQVFLMGIIPMPAWFAGIAFVVWDMIGGLNGTDGIAHDVHLSGAAFAAIYYFSKIRFTKITSIFSGSGLKSEQRKNQRYQTQSEREKSASGLSGNIKLQDEVDRILRKISQYGESSLTESERETLRYASREYQKKMNQEK